MALSREARRNPRHDPIHDPEHHPALEEGIRLFNEGKHWEAHEAWEDLWLGLEGEDKVFVQGLIMAAAMLVKYERRHGLGVYRHYQNVQDRLPPHAPERWGIDVRGLLDQLRPFAEPFLDRGWEREQEFPLDPASVRLLRNP